VILYVFNYFEAADKVEGIVGVWQSPVVA